MERNIEYKKNTKLHTIICMILFCLPMCYSFGTRYRGRNGFFAWVIKYFLPVLVVAIEYQTFSKLRFFLGLIYVYSLYEIGYIQNDCETIKKESNPTLRINLSTLDQYENNKYWIYIMRSIQILLWGSGLYLLNISPWIILLGFLTLPVFLLYNSVRNRSSLFIHLLLLIFRYSVPVIVAVNAFYPLSIIFLIILYPLTLFVERSVKGKFGYRNELFAKYILHDYSERYSFRVHYYWLLSVITIVGIVCALLPWLYLFPVVLLLFTSVIGKNCIDLHYEK